ncbi:uncharacterized protein TNCV_989741 [Trichonephila clavipes]|nr:uncharacterized protein TNCV_989741 [Trichonephila clavipes]
MEERERCRSIMNLPPPPTRFSPYGKRVLNAAKLAYENLILNAVKRAICKNEGDDDCKSIDAIKKKNIYGNENSIEKIGMYCPWNEVHGNKMMQIKNLIERANKGNVSKLKMLQKMGIEPGEYSVSDMKILDMERLMKAIYDFPGRSREISKKRKKKKENIKILRVGSNFPIIPEQYFSGVENVADFLENIDNNLTHYEIPIQLACAYLKSHLTGWALDWFEVLVPGLTKNSVWSVFEASLVRQKNPCCPLGGLKQALAEQFPVVKNRSELETPFYSSSQKHNQKPSHFVYDLLKIQKNLKLERTEEKLIDHNISRLEPQILDYVEVMHPQTTSNLLQIIDKYEERFLNRNIRGSSWEFRDTNPSENNRFLNRNRQENWKETRGNNRYSSNSRPRRESNRFESQGVVDNRRSDGRR